MRKFIFSIGLLLSLPVLADFYKVTVTRIDSNLYKTNEGIFIETQYCYEYANRDEAVLSYEQYSYNNKLIFSNNQSCDVKRVFK
ncbi:hypothetical protein Q7469_12175 [Glaesserella parasuis]|uniref:Uncharacterized protein n=2 Tax=Glaesserella parasuis TaxID=738 RepID=A0AAJ6AJU5_GLAPU|nr:hypothetical protein [Glaesserella parasuis]ATW42561.1 hypothetical protein A2U20_01460 [Glaesserella parasuis D74]KEZ14721.1 hypothetical protein HS327_02374 [Glaesserella parasuis]MCT8554020.1 hypothetical protein [Glaesserella parasuis]MCT8574842.1 hypothetical protein [Glaesserella parasuis]MCT8655804.1 hypothetical protein [Glaesserella parasuis]